MFDRVVNMHLGIAFITDLFKASFPSYCQPFSWFDADCDLLRIIVTYNALFTSFAENMKIIDVNLLTIALAAVVTRVIV